MSNSTGSLGWLDVRNEKPRKILGILLWLGFTVAAGIWIVPWIILALTSFLKLAALLAVFLAIGSIIIQPRFWWSAGFLSQRLVSLCTSLIISTDPIGVMKARLREMKSTYYEFLARIGELRGSVEKAIRDRAEYAKELEKAEGMLSALRKKGDNANPAMISQQSNIIIRREGAIARIDKEITQGRNMISLLERYANKSEAYIADTEDNINFTLRERKRLKTAWSAFAAAKKILQGQSIGADMYDEALDVASEQAAIMVGEMKQFITESRSAIEGFELEQEGAVETVLARIEQKSSQSKMLDYQPGGGVPLDLTANKQPVPVSATVNINDFLKG